MIVYKTYQVNFKKFKMSRVRKNLLGPYAPETQRIRIEDLLRDSYFDKINLRPPYQRNIRWTPVAMDDFIGTIMHNGLVPGVIMYQLDLDERIGKNEGKTFETVDGQHRLFSLKAFADSTRQHLPHIKNPFIVHWNYVFENENGDIQSCQVFYKKTDEVIEWCKDSKITNYQFLTDEEREYFDNFGINITLIRNKLSLDQRREIFMSLQKGIPVRNSDFLKNKTDCKLVAFISENNYEEMMTNTFFDHCYKKATNYWVHWVCRCFLLYKRFHKLCKNNKLNDAPESETFLLEDKEIKKLIEANSPEFNPRTDQEIEYIHDFDDVFRGFISFLQQINEEYWNRLNPTQIFALFYVLCDDSKDTTIILSHISYLSREGQARNKRSLWESRDEKGPRRDYFNRCLTQLNSITERAMPLDDRQISKALRKLVWLKCVDEKCEICEDEITEKEFEAGHIVARALGGQTEIDNLIPICFACNRGMGTRNAYEYKKDVYPYTCTDEK